MPDCHYEERSDEVIHSRALGIALFYYRCQKEAFMIQTTDNVHCVAKISKVTKVQKIDYSYFSLKDLKNLEQRYQQRAVLTNDWYYYAELLEIRKAKRQAEADQKWIKENYPCGGKSSFGKKSLSE